MPNPFSASGGFSFGGTPVWGSAAADGATDTLQLSVIARTWGHADPLHVGLPADAKVSDLLDMLRSRLGADPASMTLCCQGKPLSSPEERLCDTLGALTLHCLKRPSANVPAANAPTIAAAAAVATDAPDARAPPTAPAPAPPVNTLKVRFSDQRQVEVPFTVLTSVAQLKAELVSRDEAPRASVLRLVFAGKELLDHYVLGQLHAGTTRMPRAGETIVASLREEPPPAGVASPLHAPLATAAPPAARYVGLRNQGATCYLNSLVQTLYMLPELRAALKGASATDAPLTAALATVFRDLERAKGAVSTAPLTAALRWGPVSRQQDVHEFWQVLCEKLEEELKGSARADVLKKLFVGTQRYYVRCAECGRCSCTDDPYVDLKLHVAESPTTAAPLIGPLPAPPPASAAAPSAAPAAAPEAGTSAVHAALRELLSPERLRGDDAYSCDACARKVDAERGVSLSALPRVLTLQLKRFRYDMRRGTRVKVSSPFDFPEEIDMAPFVGPGNSPSDPPSDEPDEACPATAATAPPRAAPTGAPTAALPYELFAVLVHSGTAAFGHYLALIKDVESGGGEWHEFNDAVVRHVKPSELARYYGSADGAATWSAPTAYMLLYRARSAAPAEPEAAEPTAQRGTPSALDADEPVYRSLNVDVGSAQAEAAEVDLTGPSSKRLRLTPPLRPRPAEWEAEPSTPEDVGDNVYAYYGF